MPPTLLFSFYNILFTLAVLGLNGTHGILSSGIWDPSSLTRGRIPLHWEHRLGR